VKVLLIIHHKLHKHLFELFLDEAFCIAIVEAASCGLLVVSTRVGGVPEVLPEQLSLLSEPTTDDLLAKLTLAIENYKDVDHYHFHRVVKESYSWYDVAQRTELVYDRICKEKTLPFIERIRRFYGCGFYAGKIFCLVVTLGYLIWKFYEWLPWPETLSKALKLGHKVIFSACWYINLINYGQSWREYYECDPVEGADTEGFEDQILGGEAAIWGEFVDQTNIEARLFPYAGAVAGVLWTDRDGLPDTDNAMWALHDFGCKLLRRGIRAQPLLNGYCGPFEVDLDM